MCFTSSTRRSRAGSSTTPATGTSSGTNTKVSRFPPLQIAPDLAQEARAQNRSPNRKLDTSAQRYREFITTNIITSNYSSSSITLTAEIASKIVRTEIIGSVSSSSNSYITTREALRGQIVRSEEILGRVQSRMFRLGKEEEHRVNLTLGKEADRDLIPGEITEI